MTGRPAGERDAPRMRRAFTLFELLLVLALLVILAGLAIPSIDYMYADSRTMAAVDQVRSKWAAARGHAVGEGRAYRFSIMQNSGAFRVAPDDPAVVTAATSAETLYETWEVRNAVGELPDDEREVVRLQHFEGMTHGQIADQLGVAVGTVKSRSFRAHKRLATALGHLKE